jgi:hypothetical protein
VDARWVLHPSEAYTDKWIAIFELKVILAMLVRSLGFRDAATVVQQKTSQIHSPVVDGKGGCYRCMLSSREYRLQVLWETNQSSSLSHYPPMKQSLRCSFILELERRQIWRKEVRVEGVMGLIRDFAVDLGIKEGRGPTWWPEIV